VQLCNFKYLKSAQVIVYISHQFFVVVISINQWIIINNVSRHHWLCKLDCIEDVTGDVVISYSWQTSSISSHNDSALLTTHSELYYKEIRRKCCYISPKMAKFSIFYENLVKIYLFWWTKNDTLGCKIIRNLTILVIKTVNVTIESRNRIIELY